VVFFARVCRSRHEQGGAHGPRVVARVERVQLVLALALAVAAVAVAAAVAVPVAAAVAIPCDRARCAAAFVHVKLADCID